MIKDLKIEDEFINIPCPLKDCLVKQEVNVTHNEKIAEKYKEIYQSSLDFIEEQKEQLKDCKSQI